MTILIPMNLYADALVDSRTVIDVQWAKNKELLATAEKHLFDMEHTMTLLQQISVPVMKYIIWKLQIKTPIWSRRKCMSR
ncbi:MAG: hypothetical protein K0R15_1624 [Clostridiales bacterium]|jgi:hypothetical protein|nr:hypothetical protein [Clostridiales bacterium]